MLGLHGGCAAAHQSVRYRTHPCRGRGALGGPVHAQHDGVVAEESDAGSLTIHNQTCLVERITGRLKVHEKWQPPRLQLGTLGTG